MHSHRNGSKCSDAPDARLLAQGRNSSYTNFSKSGVAFRALMPARPSASSALRMASACIAAFLLRRPGGLPDTLTLKDELVPIHPAAPEYAHFHLLSFGPETDTLQPARYY